MAWGKSKTPEAQKVLEEIWNLGRNPDMGQSAKRALFFASMIIQYHMEETEDCIKGSEEARAKLVEWGIEDGSY